MKKVLSIIFCFTFFLNLFPILSSAHHYPDPYVDSLYGTYLAPDTHYQEYTNINSLKSGPQSFSGKGVNIAVIDSGIDSRVVNNVVNGATCINSSPCTNDFGRDFRAHGTHVAGIITGDKKGNIKGIAPNANLFDIRLTKDANSTPDDFYNALKWVEDYNSDKKVEDRIHIVNMSITEHHEYSIFGTEIKPKADTEKTRILLDRLFDSGVLLVAATGNDSKKKVGFPAYNPDVIGVGNFDGINYNKNKTYNLMHTSIGEGIEIVAPGHYINSTIPIEKDSAEYHCVGECSYDEKGHIPPSKTGWDGKKDGYQFLTGTSMAAPVVSGTLALLKEKYPQQSNVDLRDYLHKMAQYISSSSHSSNYDSSIGHYHNENFGYGLLKAEIDSVDDTAPPKNITLMDDSIPLHILPSAEFQTSTALKPQTVNVIRQSKIGSYTWFEIQTWLGNRWIRPINYKVGEFQMAIGRRTDLYESVNGAKTGGTISPQVLIVKKRSEDWFLINTYLGEKWIKPEIYYPSYFPITLNDEKTAIFDKINGKQIDNIYDETFDATEKVNEWYKLRSLLNTTGTPYEQWLKPNSYFIGEFSIELTQREKLFEIYGDIIPMNESLSPQTVYGIEKRRLYDSGNGKLYTIFKIHTWLGEKWIKPNDGTYRIFQK